MLNIRYVQGDATKPIGDGQKAIVHICNDQGKWGKGFVLALSRRWKSPELVFRRDYKRGGGNLGAIQQIQVEPDITVFNMVAQHGVYPLGGVPPIRYSFLEVCLRKVVEQLKTFKEPVSLHAPRIGAGLAGGTWDKVLEVIEIAMSDFDGPIYIYDFR